MIGKIRFSPSNLSVQTGTDSFSITQKEADILTFLFEHKNKVVKRDEVLLNVWGKNDYFLGRSMDVFISKIRKYLKADPAIVLETIHGVGFRLNVPE
jgi:DNA-binding response OmpR family regulator